MSGIISLLTDFGLADNFVGAMKGVILKVNPRARIIDICHNIQPQSIIEAAFLLKGSFKFFPKRTVHLVVVDPGVGSGRRKILVKTKNYYFIAPDNGVLALALKEEPPLKIIELANDKYFLKPVSDTFQARDIFAPVAAYVSKGEDIYKFGRQIKAIKASELPKVKAKNNELAGEIIYIDRFGNLVSNIDKETLRNFIKNKKFKISIKDKTIDGLSRSYAEGLKNKPLALIGSFNSLEIALNCGSARDYLRAGKGTKIKIKVKRF